MSTVTVIDIETTIDLDKKDAVSSPFFGQQIVFAGYNSIGDYHSDSGGLFFHHNLREPTVSAYNRLTRVLAKTDILVGHNLKFDLQWLRECGFMYNKLLFDTMVVEYLLARGEKKSLRLADCCANRGLDKKKSDLVGGYLTDGVAYEDMPPDIVKEYCMADVEITKQLAESQLEELSLTWDIFGDSSFAERA
jgi:DNA polymerase I-like protein with 3'-5' exonuclease and polymerase domains